MLSEIKTEQILKEEIPSLSIPNKVIEQNNFINENEDVHAKEYLQEFIFPVLEKAIEKLINEIKGPKNEISNKELNPIDLLSKVIELILVFERI